MSNKLESLLGNITDNMLEGTVEFERFPLSHAISAFRSYLAGRAVNTADSDALHAWLDGHRKEVDRLQHQVNDLQSGMYINCVYCGHRYGPNTEQVPAEALAKHVAACPKHPLAAANGRLARIREIAREALEVDDTETAVLREIIELTKTDPAGNTAHISDGYHTFSELYQHRNLLFISLLTGFAGVAKLNGVRYHRFYRADDNSATPTVWWSRRHHDESEFPMYPGWIIAGMQLAGDDPYDSFQVSYHLPIDYVDLIAGVVPELEIPPEFDGHTPDDVLDRLHAWIDAVGSNNAAFED